MVSNESSPIQYLDFEAPIELIQNQIDEMVAMEKKSNIDLTDKIQLLKDNLEAEKHRVTQGLSTWQKVQLSRHPNRPYALFYMDHISDFSIEIHGDRNVKDDKAIVCWV